MNLCREVSVAVARVQNHKRWQFSWHSSSSCDVLYRFGKWEDESREEVGGVVEDCEVRNKGKEEEGRGSKYHCALVPDRRHLAKSP